MFYYSKGKYNFIIIIIITLTYLILNNIIKRQRGETAVGCWDPSHPSTSHCCSLAGNHGSPAASCGWGSSKQQHLGPWRGEQAARPATMELPLDGEAAYGLCGLLHPCLNWVCFGRTAWRVHKSQHQTPPLFVSTCSCSSMCYGPTSIFCCAHPQSAPWPTAHTHAEGWSKNHFPMNLRLSVLAKTCLMLNIVTFLWIAGQLRDFSDYFSFCKSFTCSHRGR